MSLEAAAHIPDGEQDARHAPEEGDEDHREWEETPYVTAQNIVEQVRTVYDGEPENPEDDGA